MITNVHVILVVRDVGNDSDGLVRFALKIVAAGVERGIEFSCREVMESVNPIVFIRQAVVDHARIPLIAVGEDDVRERVPFVVGVWHHREIHKTVDDVERENVSIVGGDVLETSDLHGTIVDYILVVFNLSAGVDSAITSKEGVLSKNENNVAMLCGDLSGSVDKLESIEFVIVNSSDINFSGVGEDNSCITAEDTSVGSSVNK